MINFKALVLFINGGVSMGLFFDILSAVNNPKQQASVEQLSSLTQEIGQISSRFGLDNSATQSLISSLGNQLRPALQQQLSETNSPDFGKLIGQFTGGGSSNLGALQCLIPPQAQQLLLQGLTSKIGLSANSAGELLPSLLPILLKFLNLGSPAPGAAGTNPVLASFLDSDHDGDVDLGDVFKFASRFITPSH